MQIVDLNLHNLGFPVISLGLSLQKTFQGWPAFCSQWASLVLKMNIIISFISRKFDDRMRMHYCLRISNHLIGTKHLTAEVTTRKLGQLAILTEQDSCIYMQQRMFEDSELYLVSEIDQQPCTKCLIKIKRTLIQDPSCSNFDKLSGSSVHQRDIRLLNMFNSVFTSREKQFFLYLL